MSGERGAAATRIVAGVLVLFALQALFFLAAERGQRSGRGTMPFSSFRPDDSGLRAARLTLEGIGLPAESRRGAKLPAGSGHVLIRVAVHLPSDRRPPEELAAERREIADWVAAGNSLLLLSDGDLLPPPLLTTPPGGGTGPDDPDETDEPDESDESDEPDESDGEDVSDGSDIGDAGDPAVESAAPGIPDVLPRVRGKTIDPASIAEFFLGDTARELTAGPAVPDAVRDAVVLGDFEALAPPSLTPGRYVETLPTDDVWVRAADSMDALIVEREHGAGYAVVVADPFFASNVTLARSDNAAWLAEIVSRLRRGGRVWFDDRAIGQTASRGVLSLVTEGGFGPALLCGLGLLLLVWWRSGPSDSPSRATVRRDEYKPESYAHLRAGLYVDCIGEEDILRVVRDEVRRRLALGEHTGFERALDLLGTRHPERADAVRDALAQLPAGRGTTYRRYPDTWTHAVAGVWRALSGVRRDRPVHTEEEEHDGTAREPRAS